MKRGRPKSENPRNRSFRLRMTEEEFNELTQLSEKKGIEKSKLIRMAISKLRNDSERHREEIDIP